MSGILKTYNITGLITKAKLNNYDVTCNGVWLPVKIIAEYPKFLIAEVLEHRNPNGQGNSKPYKITLNKVDLFLKDVELRLT